MDGSKQASFKGQVITCKAAVCWRPGEPLLIQQIEVAPPQPSEVRIKIICSSLCHTDVTLWKNQQYTAFYPCIYGHEAVGRVESVGENVRDIEEGDLVIPVFQGQCTECKDCKSEKSNMCAYHLPGERLGVMKNDHKTRFSINGQPVYHVLNVSSFTEYTVVDIDNVVKINPMTPPDKACLLSCGITTGLGGAWKTGNVEKGSTVAIFGLGTVGLAVAQGARIRGASKIIGVDVNPRKSEIGRKLGVTDFVNPKDHDKPVNEIIKTMTEGGVDYSFECSGNPSVVVEAFHSIRRGWGKAVVLSVNMTEVPISSSALLCGKSITGSLLGGMKPKSDIPPLVDMYMKKELQLDDYITHEISFCEINKAFDLLMEGECLRCVIWFDAKAH